jgi:hypothetical protein
MSPETENNDHIHDSVDNEPPEPMLHPIVGFGLFLLVSGYLSFVLLPYFWYLSVKTFNLLDYFSNYRLMTILNAFQFFSIHMISLIFISATFQTRLEGNLRYGKYQVDSSWVHFINKQKTSRCRFYALLVGYCCFFVGAFLGIGWDNYDYFPNGADLAKKVSDISPATYWFWPFNFVTIVMLFGFYAGTVYLSLISPIGPAIVVPMQKHFWGKSNPVTC